MPTFVGATEGGTSLGAGVTCAKPAGTSATTVLVAHLSVSTARTIQDPAGWTLAAGPIDQTLGGSQNTVRARLYTALAGDVGASTTWTFDGGNSRGNVAITAWDDADSTLDVLAVTAVDNTQDTNHVAPSITTVTDGCEVIWTWCLNDASQVLTEPGTSTPRATPDAFVHPALVASETIAIAGATGTRTATSPTAAYSVGLVAALRPASVSDTTAPVLQSAAIDGATLTLTYDEALDETTVPPATNLYYTINGGGNLQDSTITISGQVITMALGTPAAAGDTITVSYQTTFLDETNKIQDLAGNDAAALTSQAVTNNTAGLAGSGTATVAGGGAVTASGTGQVTPVGESGTTTIAGGGGVTASGSGSVTPLPVAGNRRTAEYVIIAVDRTGTPIARFPQASVETVTWTLNDWPTMSFSVPNNHRRVREIQAITTEVQLWRNGVLLDWFVPLRPQGRSDAPDFKCVGLMWWLSRRHVGEANRKNWAAPFAIGSDPYVSWAPFGDQGHQAPTASVNNNLGFPPPSILLEQTLAEQDSYIRHIANVSGAPGQQKWTVKANVHISSDGTGLTFPSNVFARAFEQHGLLVNVIASGNNLLQTKIEPLSPEAGHVQPGNYRLEAEVVTPPGFLGHIEIRLYAPRSRVAWDNPTLHRDDALSFLHVRQDSILHQLVEHAQDPDFGKTDLNIGVQTAASSLIRSAAYFFHDHDNIWAEIKRLCELENGPDVDMVVTQNSRTFTIYEPSKGSDMDEITYRWGTKSIIDYSWDVDGDAGRDRIIALGEGEGSDREEGYYVDSTAWENNALEGIIAAPNTDPWWLHMLAKESVRRRIDVTVGSITVPAEGTIGRVKVGDRVPIEIDDGWTQVTGMWRVVQMTLSPDQDTIDLAVNSLMPT